VAASVLCKGFSRKQKNRNTLPFFIRAF
jgi:hypothetical protein